MKVFIISLEKDVQKRVTISAKLKELKQNFYFVDAIYGKNLDFDFVNKLNFDGAILKRGFNPTPGEIGCTLSHGKALELFLKTNDEWGCILEDDAILDCRFKKFIDGFDESIRDKVFILGGQDGLITEKLIAKSYFSKKYVDDLVLKKVIYSTKHVKRTCCYIFNRDSAKKYLDLLNKKFFLADDWYFLKQNKIFKDIYIGDFVSHPLDLESSNIEKERLKKIETKNIRDNFFYCILRKFYFFLKVFVTKIKRLMG